MSSSVGMMTFPTEWKNKSHVPNHQPDIHCYIILNPSYLSIFLDIPIIFGVMGHISNDLSHNGFTIVMLVYQEGNSKAEPFTVGLP